MVFTNRRILMFRVRGQGFNSWEWNRGIRTVAWSDLLRAKTKGFITRYLELRTRSGETENYWRLSLADSKKVRVLAEILQPQAMHDAPSPARTFVSLCPACFAPLSAGKYECSACGLRFKDEKTLVWRGILPGGAAFYVGAWPLGILHSLVDLVLLFAIVAFVVDIIQPSNNPNAAATHSVEGIFILVGIVLLEKGVSILHCRRSVRNFLPIG
jgi:hypothetical protein